MRLLNTQTLKLTEFSGSDIPEYAILSHTWGADGEEVSFKDIEQDQKTWENKLGATKAKDFSKLADTRGYDWVWIDTCCIYFDSSRCKYCRNLRVAPRKIEGIFTPQL
jgi:hypothetical protein